MATVLSVQLDASAMILQAIVGLFKLGIASFLLWLIADLFVLRPFARAESRMTAMGRSRLASVGQLRRS